jgi:DNA polymerase-1
MYCEFHQYWKDEGKEWNPKTTPEDQLWVYNCKDAVITYECSDVMEQLLTAMQLWEQFKFQLYELWPELVKMMLRGVAINNRTRAEIALELVAAIDVRHQFFFNILGQDLNPRSIPQMRALFYDRLKCPVIKHRKTKRPTLNEEALEETATKEPLLYPLVDAINEERSLGVFMNTFVKAPLDADGRMRCYYGFAETYRLTSSENAFGKGTNLQNIPKGDRSSTMVMPNIRRLFVPDPNYVILEPDLAGADAQVVAWEAGDDVLKEIFRKRLKLHAENAKMLYEGLAGPDGKREPYYTRTKQGCHLLNYGGSAYTLAKTIGITQHEADQFRNRWFAIHPAIADWHRRVEADLVARREVRNKFGYRRHYFDRIQSILPEALAWVPQSTVACVINRGLVRIAKQLVMRYPIGLIELLLQVHDSLVLQVKRTYLDHILPELEQQLLIPIPYDDPLTIPLGLKASPVSWGDAEDYPWSKEKVVCSAPSTISH